MAGWARFVSRTARFWMVVWPVAAVGVWLPAPRIPALLRDDDTGFLPAEMPSQQAFARLKEAFPDHAPLSRAVIVMARDAGLVPEDRAWLDAVTRGLRSKSAELGWRIRSPSSSPFLKPVLESDDGRAAIIVVELPAEFLTHSSVRRVREVQGELTAHPAPPGLRVDVTGTAALGELLDRHAKRDVDRTTVWAFAGVMVILLVIYRSPVAMLLPVVTIALSLMVSLGIIGWAASWGLPINGLVQMFIVVLLVGSGVDYCLFLFARFREAMSAGQGERAEADVTSAVETAVRQTGGAILASAGTNVVGLATLLLADDRDLYTSGPTIAFAIGVGTLAVLTLTPSVMRVVGRRLYWPGSAITTQRADGAAWSRVARLVTARPAWISLIMVALLAIPAALTLRARPLYDVYDEYPADSSFVRGARLYEQHFFGTRGVSDQTLLISADGRLDTPQVEPVLNRTLDAFAETMDRRFPLLYQRDLQDPLGRWRSHGSERPAQVVDPLTKAMSRRLARDYYVGRGGKTIRIDFGLSIEPRSAEAMDLVPRIREAAREVVSKTGLAAATGGLDVRIDLAGGTSVYADLRDLRHHDFRIVAMAAVVSILLILWWLIRSFVQSLVLIAATLLTFLATYGGTWLIFTRAYGLEGLNWSIDFLLFIIIMALGQDYNIYVVTRIREELRNRPPAEAIGVAVRRTGRVVSSCGIIMAAAFASMASGSLLLMKEFAVALAMGVLIDTFAIRPLLVPAVILLLTRRSVRMVGGGGSRER